MLKPHGLWLFWGDSAITSTNLGLRSTKIVILKVLLSTFIFIVFNFCFSIFSAIYKVLFKSSKITSLSLACLLFSISECFFSSLQCLSQGTEQCHQLWWIDCCDYDPWCDSYAVLPSRTRPASQRNTEQWWSKEKSESSISMARRFHIK